jgi:hypothetical protein
MSRALAKEFPAIVYHEIGGANHMTVMERARSDYRNDDRTVTVSLCSAA